MIYSPNFPLLQCPLPPIPKHIHLFTPKPYKQFLHLMDFFKSVLSEDPQPPSTSNNDEQNEDESSPNLNPNTYLNGSTWSFGGLIKSLANKSESVIQTYRRDLEEFGSGLNKETSVIREVASRVVKDFPASLDIGASVAQESLESVGQAIDDIGSTVWKSTAGIISHGRDALSAVDLDSDLSNSGINRNRKLNDSCSRGLDSIKHGRFELQLRAIQSSESTYLEEPEDLETYKDWKLGFILDDKGEEIDNLIRENRAIEEIYKEIVPRKVGHEAFWLRYLYKVHKLREIEEARSKLVKRAISGEEEELSWDLDDKDENEEKESNEFASSGNVEEEEEEKQIDGEVVNESVSDKLESNSDEKEGSEEGKNSSGDSCKYSDVSIVSRPEEEDLGWDEIEDIGRNNHDSEGDGVRVSSSSIIRVDLHKRLSAAEEDEDFSWDIQEDDDDDHKPPLNHKLFPSRSPLMLCSAFFFRCVKSVQN